MKKCQPSKNCQPPELKPKPILIERYGRRRFFHVDANCFVSAVELVRLKQKGFGTVIRQAGTSEDLTEVLIVD